MVTASVLEKFIVVLLPMTSLLSAAIMPLATVISQVPVAGFFSAGPMMKTLRSGGKDFFCSSASKVVALTTLILLFLPFCRHDMRFEISRIDTGRLNSSFRRQFAGWTTPEVEKLWMKLKASAAMPVEQSRRRQHRTEKQLKKAFLVICLPRDKFVIILAQIMRFFIFLAVACCFR